MKIIMMKKMCKNPKRFLVTEFIFCNNPMETNGKILLGIFFRGNQGDAKKYVIPAALYTAMSR